MLGSALGSVDGEAESVGVSSGSLGEGDADSAMLGDYDGAGGAVVALGCPIVQALRTISDRSDNSVSQRFMGEPYGQMTARRYPSRGHPGPSGHLR